MPFVVSCTPPAFFVSEKGRKLLIKVPIGLFNATAPLPATCAVRVRCIAGSPTFSVQAVPGEWTASGAHTVVSAAFPSAGPIPAFNAWPFFLELSNLAVPTLGYVATYEIQVIDPTNLANPGNHGRLEFNVSGNGLAAVSRKVVFALDRGRTMMNGGPAYPQRIDRLRAAASTCLGVLRDDDEIGVVIFNTAATTEVALGSVAAQRAAAATLCSASAPDARLTPSGYKSIQAGIDHARSLHADADVIVLSDGTSTRQPSLPALPFLQTPRTHALMFGESLLPHANALKLVSVAGNVAAPAPSASAEFGAEKQLTQILLNIAGVGVVSDPDGALAPGESLSFPLELTEGDRELELIVFATEPKALDVRLTGVKREPQARADFASGATFRDSAVRDDDPCAKPAAAEDELGKGPEPFYGERVLVRRLKAPSDEALGRFERIEARVARAQQPNSAPERVRFSLLVSTKSDLRLDAAVHTSGLEVGSELLFSAVLTEYGLPLRRNAEVLVLLRHPDGGTEELQLAPSSPGRFEGTRRALRPGAYLAHFVATGKTWLLERRFRREMLATALVGESGSSSAPSCCPSACSELGGRLAELFREVSSRHR